MIGDAMNATDETVVEYVTAMIDRQLFGLPIARVQDVFVPARLTHVPLAPEVIAGVLNLRGRIVTVIDMRCRLGLPKYSGGATQMAIGIEQNGEAYGLLVDSVGEVMRISDSIRAANPVNLDPRLAEVSTGVFRLEAELLIVLSVDQVLAFGTAMKAA
jgi:purine-binding chemotaxis protein CheW